MFPVVLIFLFSLFRDQQLLDPTLEYVKVGNQNLTCNHDPKQWISHFLTQCCQATLLSGLCGKLMRWKQPGDNLTVSGL